MTAADANTVHELQSKVRSFIYSMMGHAGEEWARPALVALDALQAKAETPWDDLRTTNELRRSWQERDKAEAERDAAVQAAERAEQERDEERELRAGLYERAEAAEQAAEQLDKERHDAYRIGAKTAEKLVAAEQAAEQARNALDDALDVAIWLTGVGDLTDIEAWPAMREKLNGALRARAALAGNRP